MAADDDSARIYLMSADKAEMGVEGDSLAAWAAARVAQVPHVLAVVPSRPRIVAGKAALQCTVLRELTPGGRTFGYRVTFIDAADRFDDWILGGHEIEHAAPVLADVLAKLEYRA
jgi:hypothetical protein